MSQTFFTHWLNHAQAGKFGDDRSRLPPTACMDCSAESLALELSSHTCYSLWLAF